MTHENENIAPEKWFPFEDAGRVFCYRMPLETFYRAITELFDRNYGGYDPTNSSHYRLRTRIDSSVRVSNSYCYMDSNIAEILEGTQDSNDASIASDDADVLLDRSAIDILDCIIQVGQLFPGEISESLVVDRKSAQAILEKLRHYGLVVPMTDGRYVLTKEGLLRWGKEKFKCGLAGDADYAIETTLRWEESLLCVHGFEKDFWFLSNFYAVPIDFEGIRFLNSEAAYQAGRCKLDSEKTVFAGLSAAAAKKHAHHEIETREDWDEIRIEHMKHVISSKFSQHEDLIQRLIETKGVLEETNLWGDNFWGDSRTDKDRGTRGKNMLGKILMEEREQWSEFRGRAGFENIRKVHCFKLDPEPWEAISNGTKDIELRILDEKRKMIRPGDSIIFTRSDGIPGEIEVRVEFIDIFPSFEDLFRDLDDPGRCGLTTDAGKDVSTHMKRYYRPEELNHYCAMAIGIKLLSIDTKTA